MNTPTINFDSDGYPTDESCESIAKAEVKSYADCEALLQVVQAAWTYPDRFGNHTAVDCLQRPIREWSVSTGGWSGNESLVFALQQNAFFWALCWHQSTRGGHYLFHIPCKGDAT